MTETTFFFKPRRYLSCVGFHRVQVTVIRNTFVQRHAHSRSTNRFFRVKCLIQTEFVVPLVGTGPTFFLGWIPYLYGYVFFFFFFFFLVGLCESHVALDVVVLLCCHASETKPFESRHNVKRGALTLSNTPHLGRERRRSRTSRCGREGFVRLRQCA